MNYSEKTLDHFFNPRNVGIFEDHIQKGEGISGLKGNGDVIQFQVKIMDEKVIDSKFKAYGTCASIAAASYLTEWVKNKELTIIRNLDLNEVSEELQLPKLKYHCALLAIDAMKKAIDDYFVKYG